jgi:hypothetical protein
VMGDKDKAELAGRPVSSGSSSASSTKSK